MRELNGTILGLLMGALSIAGCGAPEDHDDSGGPTPKSQEVQPSEDAEAAPRDG